MCIMLGWICLNVAGIILKLYQNIKIKNASNILKYKIHIYIYINIQADIRMIV